MNVFYYYVKDIMLVVSVLLAHQQLMILTENIAI